MEIQVTTGNEVTCLLTSCGRFDLLRRTLDSFFLHNTYPIHDFIVYEDSGNGVPDELKKLYPTITWIEPHERKGQIFALDTLWNKCTTPWAFMQEDDWEFVKDGFIEASMEIMQIHPTIYQVWLQPIEEHNQHPVAWGIKTSTGIEYGMLTPLFSAIRFNPSLKRKSDYDLIAPFGKHTVFNPEKPWKAEADIAKVYTNLGFRAAILPERYIKHIGENRRVKP